MSTKDKTQQELQYEALKRDHEALKRDHEALKRDYEALKQKGFEETIATKQKHSASLQSELDDLKKDHEALKRDHEALKQQGFEETTKQKHSAKFWEEIWSKCKKNDTQYIKSLVDNKTLSVNDVDDSD
eukprot:142863_1